MKNTATNDGRDDIVQMHRQSTSVVCCKAGEHTTKSSDSKNYSSLQQQQYDDFSPIVSSHASAATMNEYEHGTVSDVSSNTHAYSSLPDIPEAGKGGNLMHDGIINNMIENGEYYSDDDDDDVMGIFPFQISEMVLQSKHSRSLDQFHGSINLPNRIAFDRINTESVADYNDDESSEEATGFIIGDCNDLEFENEFYDEDDEQI